MDNILKLPDEMVLLIFSFMPKRELLNSCMFVCKSWNTLSLECSLWENVNFRSLNLQNSICLCKFNCDCVENVPPHLIEKLIIYGIKKLNLSDAILRTELITLRSLNNDMYVKLQNLNLKNACVGIDNLYQLLSRCKYLSVLDLSNADIDFPGSCNITVTELLRCIAAIEDLQELYLFGSICLSPPSMLMICDSLKTLKILDISYTFMCEESLNVLCEHIPTSITVLRMVEFHDLQDIHVQRIVHRCPNIIEFNVAKCTNLSQSSIFTLCDSLSDLNVLDISHTSIDTESLDVLCNKLPTSITVLRMEKLHPQNMHVQQIVNRCPNITEFSIASCYSLDFRCMSILCDSLANLNILDISRTSLDESDLYFLSMDLPTSLTVLRMMELYDLHDGNLRLIVNRCPNIIEFNIAGCVSLSSSCIDIIVTGLPKIQILDIRGKICMYSDWSVVQEVGKQLQNLKQLKLLRINASNVNLRKIQNLLKNVIIIPNKDMYIV